jgi:Na+/H+ antiporter NhaC
MRRLFDKYHISREKLAFIVDATSAPITSIAFITTWIGFELSQIDTSLAGLNLDVNAYQLFLGSLKFAFYPVLMLIFTFILIKSGKDFGLMKTKELDKIRVINTEKKEILSNNNDSKAWRAVLPVAIINSNNIVALAEEWL